MIKDMFMTTDRAVDSNGNKKKGRFTESNKGTTSAMMTLELIEKDEKVLIITQSAPALAKELIYAAAGINMSSETFDTEERKHLKSALEYLYNKRNNIAMVEEEYADFSWLSKEL